MLTQAILTGLSAATLAQARVAARGSSSNGCSLQLDVSGSINGDVGQLSSGQARVGSGISQSTFTLTSEGSLVDSQGRGCWWTPPTYTLQCDEGQNPTTGFEVGCDGTVSYNGQTTFWECFGGVSGQYNLYLGDNAFECGQVTIMADGCYGDCPASSQMQSPPPAKTTVVAPPPVKTTMVVMPPPAKTSMMAPPPMKSSMPPPPPPNNNQQPSGSCPANLNGEYQYPHLIIPIDSSQPSSAPGSSYFGEVSSTVSSVFNFDIPSSYSGQTCSLVFLFPTQSELETSSYTCTGSGAVEFCMLSSPAVQGQTSYDNCPSQSTCYGSQTVAPGNSYTVATFACPAGETVGFEMSGSGDFYLRYFQDYNPSPIGMYITAC